MYRNNHFWDWRVPGAKKSGVWSRKKPPVRDLNPTQWVLEIRSATVVCVWIVLPPPQLGPARAKCHLDYFLIETFESGIKGPPPFPNLICFPYLFIFWGNVAWYAGSQLPDQALKLHPPGWTRRPLGHQGSPHLPKSIPGWPLRPGPSLPHVQLAPRSIPSPWVWETAL